MRTLYEEERAASDQPTSIRGASDRDGKIQTADHAYEIAAAEFCQSAAPAGPRRFLTHPTLISSSR